MEKHHMFTAYYCRCKRQIVSCFSQLPACSGIPYFQHTVFSVFFSPFSSHFTLSFTFSEVQGVRKVRAVLQMLLLCGLGLRGLALELNNVCPRMGSPGSRGAGVQGARRTVVKLRKEGRRQQARGADRVGLWEQHHASAALARGAWERPAVSPWGPQMEVKEPGQATPPDTWMCRELLLCQTPTHEVDSWGQLLLAMWAVTQESDFSPCGWSTLLKVSPWSGKANV